MSSNNEGNEASNEALKTEVVESDNEIEIKEKPKRERTQAQKDSLLKAQIARKANLEKRQKEAKKKLVKEVVKEIAIQEESEESSSSEEEVIIRKKKPKVDKAKPIKKKIIYDEVSDDEEPVRQPKSLKWSDFRFV